MAAQALIDEINDYFEVIQIKIDRIKKHTDKLESVVSKLIFKTRLNPKLRGTYLRRTRLSRLLREMSEKSRMI